MATEGIFSVWESLGQVAQRIFSGPQGDNCGLQSVSCSSRWHLPLRYSSTNSCSGDTVVVSVLGHVPCFGRIVNDHVDVGSAQQGDN